jgi:putative transposase
MRRFAVLRPHLEDGIALSRAADHEGIPLRNAQRWLAHYREGGLAALARQARSDRGQRRFPEELVAFTEALVLRRPAPSLATVHREASSLAAGHGWPEPSYAWVYALATGLDPGLAALAHEGDKAYRESYDLIYRREAARPNGIWQADHTELDLWVLDSNNKPARPWLTVILDDHSRAVPGYAVNLEAPSAFNTALALRQGIWRKSDPDWHVCGIPEVFYSDHGCDFTSEHMEHVGADLKIRLVFSAIGQPRGRGKIERFFLSVNQLCLSALPGYAPSGSGGRPQKARLTLSELDAAIGKFIAVDYHHRVHSETGEPPQQRWEQGGFLPRMPDSLEQLDLLLLTVAKPRKIHPDGIHFQGLRYLDPVMADCVGEQVVIRYDPRDVTEVRVFTSEGFLCRAICPELSTETVSLKQITAARTARRKELAHNLHDRASVVDRLLAVHTNVEPKESPPADKLEPEASPPVARLKRYREE